MSAPERHSAETKNNGTAIRHAPQRIVANKSKGAQWGSSGRWISPHTPRFGMCVEYVRADLHDALLTRLASAEAALARAREEALEEAARICIRVEHGDYGHLEAECAEYLCAKAIRARARALRNGETGGEHG